MAKIKTQERIKSKSKSTNNPFNTKKDVQAKLPIFNSIITATCIGIAAWFSYKGYLETRVNTPYNIEKVWNFL